METWRLKPGDLYLSPFKIMLGTSSWNETAKDIPHLGFGASETPEAGWRQDMPTNAIEHNHAVCLKIVNRPRSEGVQLEAIV